MINAAAYTAVDQAEEEPKLAEKINSIAPGVLAKTTKKIGAAFIHFSTDYVFDGLKSGDYDEMDVPNPIQVYGKTKLRGEELVQDEGGIYLILRTSWLYSLRRENFLLKILGLAHTEKELRIVTDQIGSPTSAAMLAKMVVEMLFHSKVPAVEWQKEHCGVYHLAGEGRATRYEFAKKIVELDPQAESQTVEKITPIVLGEYQGKAKRPLNTALNTDKFAHTFGLRLPDWQTGLMKTLKLA